MEISNVFNDEPASHDRLNRDKYANALARLAESCDTPLVVGLYGTWGTGKTSLMKLIETKLNKAKVLSIWFDPWQHQFDESPLLALTHTLTSAAALGSQAEKLLTVVAAAFGSVLLRATTSLSLKDIDELGERLERERFMVREAQVRLRDHFREIVEKAQGKPKKRLVFFIDDLDRCVPHQIMKMLESLKLYLNIPGCVYFLGVDRAALECSIKLQYKDMDLSERSYLDKIVQLPFTIPPILYDSIGEFIQHLLPRSLKTCRDMLATGLGENPREIKRFVNALILNHNLAVTAAIPSYNPQILAALLLIHQHDSTLYEAIARDPQLFLSLSGSDQEESAPRSNARLISALSEVKVAPKHDLRPYIYLTQLVNISQGEGQPYRTIDLGGISAAHLRWIESKGGEGKMADLSGFDLSHANLEGMNLTRAQLKGIVLKNATLKGAALSKADLRNANLSGANLDDADLSFADLAGANLSDADLRSVNLKGANVKNADFSGSMISPELFESIGSMGLKGVNLSGLDLSHKELGGVDLGDAKLCKANLSGSRLCEANLIGADFSGANLLSADFRGARADRAVFVGCQLSGVSFESAILREAKFTGTRLGRCDLRNADLRRVDFEGSNLADSDLSGADLANASLNNCAFVTADLSGTVLLGCDLRRTTGLTLQQVQQAITDESTLLPYLLSRDE